MWFLASCIWAADVSKVKQYTAPQRIIYEVKTCNSNITCSVGETANYAKLNVSLVSYFSVTPVRLLLEDCRICVE